MTVRSRFHQVDRDTKNNIVYIEDDFDLYGGIKTVTNDAENVVSWFRSIYGNRVRIVYRDTDMQWWEIVWSLEHPSRTVVSFRQWHGLAWDKLSRVES